MNFYNLTKTVISENGGTQVIKPRVFLSKKDAKQSLLDDLNLEKSLFKHKLKEFYIVEESDFYKYYYKDVNLGFTTIVYKIWVNEL